MRQCWLYISLAYEIEYKSVESNSSFVSVHQILLGSNLRPLVSLQNQDVIQISFNASLSWITDKAIFNVLGLTDGLSASFCLKMKDESKALYHYEPRLIADLKPSTDQTFEPVASKIEPKIDQATSDSTMSDIQEKVVDRFQNTKMVEKRTDARTQTMCNKDQYDRTETSQTETNSDEKVCEKLETCAKLLICYTQSETIGRSSYKHKSYHNFICRITVTNKR